MITIPLSSRKYPGLVALADDDDRELLARHTWCPFMHPSGMVYALAGFRLPGGRKVTVTMHKLITGWPETDHRDRNGLNNQRSNLREATSAQNQANKGHRTGRYKGIHQYGKHGRWKAQIQVNGKKTHLGVFDDEVMAARAYDAAAIRIWGEFACLNFPDDGSNGALGYGDVA